MAKNKVYTGPERRDGCDGCNKKIWNFVLKRQITLVVFISVLASISVYASSSTDSQQNSRLTAMETHMEYQSEKLDELISLAKDRNIALEAM